MLSAFLLFAAVSGAAPSPAVDSFLAQARTSVSVPHVDQVRTMGRNADISRRITEQVLAGDKRVTVARLAEFAERGWSVPKAGDIVLVTDFDGQPAFLYRVVAAQVLPFGEVSAAQVAGESPGLRDIDAWRTAHRGSWKAALEGLTPEQVDAVPVVWQEFTPIYPVRR